jgi:hypothetical protein
MSVEQWALLIGAVAALIGSVARLIMAWSQARRQRHRR